VPKKFDYGYAITAHKSQGSEWLKVLVVEEKFPFDKLEHARWLYTAATRASEKLVIVRN
jgi:ATP-dependent exoDNAse (exonuclease V) alpha subunit